MSEVSTNREFMAVVEFQILPKWFELDTRTQRDYALQIASMMERYTNVKCRWFDTDAWTSAHSDFVICEFEDLNAYNQLWSEMRRHPFLASPYAKIGHILMGMELETKGLAKLADDPTYADYQEEEEDDESEPSLEKPPPTTKPAKPKRGPFPKRPPSISKPTKAEASSRATLNLSLTSCHFCGHSIKRSARFCSRCGTPSESSGAF
jgi:zinc-ribbon domain